MSEPRRGAVAVAVDPTLHALHIEMVNAWHDDAARERWAELRWRYQAGLAFVRLCANCTMPFEVTYWGRRYCSLWCLRHNDEKRAHQRAWWHAVYRPRQQAARAAS